MLHLKKKTVYFYPRVTDGYDPSTLRKRSKKKNEPYTEIICAYGRVR